jgi:hypothetical protein
MLLDKNNKDQVRVWQEFLNTQGENLRADGIWGPLTDQATRRFQKMCVLREDGLVGDGTIAQAKARGFAGFAQDETAPDPLPEGKLTQVHPHLAARADQIITLAQRDGFTIIVTQGLRTFAEQDALYAQGRTRKGPKVTNAKGGQSNHNYGLAVDFGFVINGQISWDDHLYARLGIWSSTVDLAWGGNWHTFKDLPHVEFHNIPKWPVLLAKYQHGGLAEVWKDF